MKMPRLVALGDDDTTFPSHMRYNVLVVFPNKHKAFFVMGK